MPEVTVTDNREAHRYEAHADGKLAGFADYVLNDGEIVFTHTEVDSAFEGQGIGGALARGALDDVRDQGGRTVRPQCEFIRKWIDGHPDYKALVADQG